MKSESSTAPGPLPEEVTQNVLKQLHSMPLFEVNRWEESCQSYVEQLLQKMKNSVSDDVLHRVHQEFFGWGPIEPLIRDEDVSEILIHGPSLISIEKHGTLERTHLKFFSPVTFQNFVHRLNRILKTQLSLNFPFSNGSHENLRVHVCSDAISTEGVLISIRKHQLAKWTLKTLLSQGWANTHQIDFLENAVASRKNILIVGPTSSGKTSALNALLKAVPGHERVGIIEDTQELQVPNCFSFQMISRYDPQQVLRSITLSDLIKESLRMRPDRIVVGEVRGGEAKDLLLALSTGHEGSFGTLHANSAQEALLRLEMLVQMGAPDWSLQSIRRLIHLSLHYIVVVGRSSEGVRCLKGISRITSVEDFGILTERVF